MPTTIKIKFLTYPVGHLVSYKEYDRLKKGFAKVGMELIREESGPKDDPNLHIEYDFIMVKGFSHNWEEVTHKNNLNKPIIYLSIGTEWKLNATPELNEPIRELYEKADAVVHISNYCKESHKAIFPSIYYRSRIEEIIIPAEEPKLPEIYPDNVRLKLATTCIPRPVKRNDQLEELCKKYDIELVPAWGGVSDFSYYHNCDGYIHLSRKEGMPNTILEALAYGLPCIVTNYGGASEAVGDAGIIIKNDPEGVAWDPDNILPVDEILFADAIEEFKQRLPELRIKVRERVLTELNDYVCACKFKEVFQSLL